MNLFIKKKIFDWIFHMNKKPEENRKKEKKRKLKN
jgi:hypothetical protein